MVATGVLGELVGSKEEDASFRKPEAR
eukprot:COSAG03_NODE_3278_length_2106_cov_83.128798_1_plen_26_part_10